VAIQCHPGGVFGERHAFKEHLAGCNPCQVVVDNIRQTITLYKEGKPYELPVAFRDRLHEALRQRWKEKQGEVNT